MQLALDTCAKISRTINTDNLEEMTEIVTATIGTKFSARWGPQMVEMAIKAVRKVVQKRGDYTEVDVKRYVRIEKIPGGQVALLLLSQLYFFFTIFKNKISKID